MNYSAYYQKNYRRNNKQKIRQAQTNLYNLYKTEYSPCIFCHNIIQLNACMTHLRTHKCTEIQKTINNYDELLIKFKRNINEMRSSLRLQNDEFIE
mgnify:CR=1 FL=1